MAARSGSGASPPLPSSARGGPISHGIFRVARLHKLLARQLLRRTGLHPNQELLMMHLWDTGAQRQADLVAVLESDSATITRSIQRLERAGFVRRTPSPDDRRAVIVEPTAASLSLRRKVEEAWRALESLTVQEMSDAEQAQAMAVLHRLETNLMAALEQTEPD